MRDRLWLHLLRRGTASIIYWLHQRRLLRRLDFKLQQLCHYVIYLNNLNNNVIHISYYNIHEHVFYNSRISVRFPRGHRASGHRDGGRTFKKVPLETTD